MQIYTQLLREIGSYIRMFQICTVKIHKNKQTSINVNITNKTKMKDKMTFSLRMKQVHFRDGRYIVYKLFAK